MELVDSKIELSAESKYSTKEVQKMWALNNDQLKQLITELGFIGDLRSIKIKEDLINLYFDLKYCKTKHHSAGSKLMSSGKSTSVPHSLNQSLAKTTTGLQFKESKVRSREVFE